MYTDTARWEADCIRMLPIVTDTKYDAPAQCPDGSRYFCHAPVLTSRCLIKSDLEGESVLESYKNRYILLESNKKAKRNTQQPMQFTILLNVTKVMFDQIKFMFICTITSYSIA